MSKKIVAIVGSPNVGKSTIFNRLLGDRRAIVDDERGLTRDRLYANGSWLGKDFVLIDTGGVELENKPFQEQIRIQTNIAIDEADIIVFVTDVRLGVSKDDEMVARILKKSKKPIILAVNKVDDKTYLQNIFEFYSLGLGEPIAVSGLHGVGIGEVLDKITSNITNENEEQNDNETITFCLIGRPNVGKSSLTNAILNQERVIVSDIAGTTRDSIDTNFIRDGKKYCVIDTAGLKRRGKIYEAIDKYSAIRALKAIERSEIVLLTIDGNAGIVEQDKHVIEYAVSLKKAIVIVVNKWDLIDKETNTMSSFTKEIRKQYKFLDYAPVVFLSALTKKRIQTLFEALELVHTAYHTRIKTSLLNQVMEEAQIMNQTPDFNGGRLKIYYANQVSSAPPHIVLVVNNSKFMHFSYQRYIENRLRETFNFDGTPIMISLKNHSKIEK